MVKLPTQYQIVEYLENTGTQYIDTEVVGKVNLEVHASVAFTNNLYFSNMGLLGCRQDSGAKRFYIISAYQNTWHVGLGDDVQSSDYISENVLYEVDFSLLTRKCILNVNDSETLNFNTKFTSTTYPMFLFACNNYGTASRFCPAKVYNLSIAQDGVPVRYFVPCYRKSDNEPGMYDLVSQRFFTNSGNGKFSVGHEVSWDTASLLERRRMIMSASNYEMLKGE